MSIRQLWFGGILSLALAGLLRAEPGAAPSRHAKTESLASTAETLRRPRLLMRPRAGVSDGELKAAELALQLRERATFRHVGGIRVVEGASTATVKATVAALKATGLYDYVEADVPRYPMALPNDPRFGEQWALRNTGQSGGIAGADIRAEEAWTLRSSAADVIVAVMDTGVRYTHEDLAANMWRNPAEIAGNGIDDDGNGYVDDVHGINSLVNRGTPGSGDPNDDQGHGTSVASAIGAVGNNGKGISGVAWQVQIMALKFDDADGVLGAGGFTSNAVECIDYAIAKGAKVINISYGGSAYSQAEYEALRRARENGIVVVAAAGNDGNSNDFTLSYPAAHLLDNVIGVANTNDLDELAESSTFGGMTELAAPGNEVLVAARDSDTAYRTVSGTSLSSPVVAGAFALMKAQFPTDNHRQLINRVLRSVDRLPSLSGAVQSGGRLNLHAALASTSNAPFNDAFAHRAVLSGEVVTARGTSTGATSEAGEPLHAGHRGASLWWSWTAPRDGTVFVDTLGSTFDTTVGIYAGNSVSSLTAVASNDNATGRTTSRASFIATSGRTYHIAVDGKASATGLLSLAIAMQRANDNFNAAETLTGTSAQVLGYNVNAARENNEPALNISGASAAGFTVWYKWTAPRSGDFTIAVESDGFDPVVGVYRGVAVSGLTQVAIDAPAVSFSATRGQTYHFAVDTLGSGGGSFVLSLLEAYGAIEIGSSVPSSPAQGPGNAIVAVNSSGYVLYNTETTAWFKKLPGSVDVSSPAVAADGTMYITTSRGLFALRPDQSIRWEKRFDAGISGSAAIGSDGSVYVHVDDGMLRSYTAAGQERWAVSVPGESYSSPSVSSSGTVYIGSSDHHVYAVSAATGTVSWTFDAGGEVYASVAIGNDGTLYVGTLGSRFFALTPSGTEKWSFTAGGAISSSAALAPDGSVYFGAYDGKLHALQPGGTLKWTYSTAGDIRASSPAVDSQGTIYIGSNDGTLHAVSPAGAVVQTYPTGSAVRSSPLITPGSVIFGSEDGLLYFLYPDTEAASSPWPMHRGAGNRNGFATVVATAPVIGAQPISRAVAPGGTAVLSVSVSGQAPLTYQWYRNGAAIPGATAATYSIANATEASAGNYTVVVSNSMGTVTSSVARVVIGTSGAGSRIINLSARAVAGTEAKTLIVGFAITGDTGSKELLIRGVGPTLMTAPFNVPGPLSDPRITVYQGATALSSNDDWGGAPSLAASMAQVSAFAYASASSKDAAALSTLSPGNYTVHVSGNTGNTSGVALAEFYDSTQVFTAGTPRLTNISARSEVGVGSDVLIVGFVISGTGSKTVLIRGIGPTLGANYGVAGALADPRIELFQGQTLIEQNNDWGTAANAAELEATMPLVGAFALPKSSKDAAMLVTLEPGVPYTAVVSGVNNTRGVALAEVYEAP